jgi:hypothetical protein
MKGFLMRIAQLIISLFILSCTFNSFGEECVKPYPDKVPCPGPKVEIKQLHGAPAMYIDSQLTVPIFASKGRVWGVNDLPKIEEGKLVLTNKPGYYAYRDITSTDRFGKNYSVEVSMKMVKELGKGSGIGLTVQIGRQGCYLFGLYNLKGESHVRLWKEETGLKGWYHKWINKPFKWETGKFYNLKIELKGDTISAYVNNQLIGMQKDTKVLKSGKIRLGAYHCVAEFDNVTVKNGENKLLFKDDFSQPRSSAWSGQPLKKAKVFKDVGIHIYTHAGWGGLYNWDKCFLSPENKYDFKKIDKELNGILANDPDAYFVPRISIRVPTWWKNKYPDELMRLRRTYGPAEKYKYGAFSSKIWLEEVSEFLRQYIRHLNKQEYGKRVLGLTLMAGGGGEWVYSFEPYFFDYSKPQLFAYRDWLKKQYVTLDALRREWKKPLAEFENIEIPSPAEKMKAFDFEFRQPLEAKSICDYMKFHSIAVTRMIEQLAKVVKEETDNKKLVFVFYGYLFASYRSPKFLECGHMNYENFLKSPFVDCVGSLHAYEWRQPGGVTISVAPLDSPALYNKMPFSEDDPRTHLSSANALHKQEGRAVNMFQTLNIIKRDFAYLLSKNAGFWYMDWGNGWFNDDKIMDLLGKIKNITKISLSKDRRKNNQIAVIVSENSYNYLRNSDNLLNDLVARQVFTKLPHIGAPFGTYHLGALDKMPDHELYIFLNAFKLSDKDKKAIDAKIKKKGKTALWLYAPGYVTDKGLSLKAIEELTGIKLNKIDAALNLQAKTINASFGKVRFKNGIEWGNLKKKLGPVFYCSDPNVVSLAAYGNASGEKLAGKNALVAKKMDNWRSIWCGVPNIPADLLKEIARSAGVHIYSESDDYLVANRYMVSLHAKEGGEKTIYLPRKMKVTDVFSGKIIAANADKFKVRMEKAETGIWFVE